MIKQIFLVALDLAFIHYRSTVLRCIMRFWDGNMEGQSSRITECKNTIIACDNR